MEFLIQQERKEKRRKIVAKSCLLSLKRSAKGLQARFKVRQLIDFTPLSRLGECSVYFLNSMKAEGSSGRTVLPSGRTVLPVQALQANGF